MKASTVSLHWTKHLLLVPMSGVTGCHLITLSDSVMAYDAGLQ
jgi:hypothetical protein